MKLEIIKLDQGVVNESIAQCEKKSWIVVYEEDKVLKYKELPSIADDQVYVKVAERLDTKPYPTFIFRNNLPESDHTIVINYTNKCIKLGVEAPILLIVEVI